eukprot:951698-Pelagomonas_calceolata.AAC.10
MAVCGLASQLRMPNRMSVYLSSQPTICATSWNISARGAKRNGKESKGVWSWGNHRQKMGMIGRREGEKGHGSPTPGNGHGAHYRPSCFLVEGCPLEPLLAAHSHSCAHRVTYVNASAQTVTYVNASAKREQAVTALRTAGGNVEAAAAVLTFGPDAIMLAFDEWTQGSISHMVPVALDPYVRIELAAESPVLQPFRSQLVLACRWSFILLCLPIFSSLTMGSLLRDVRILNQSGPFSLIDTPRFTIEHLRFNLNPGRPMLIGRHVALCTMLNHHQLVQTGLQAAKTLPTSIKEKRIPRTEAPSIPFTKSNKRKKSVRIRR